MHKERKNTLPYAHSFLDYKHMGITVTHRDILGEIALCTLCALFPFGLLGGPIVLDGFVGNLLKFELGSTQEEEKERDPTKKWFCF
jgi:hypothetical protein